MKPEQLARAAQDAAERRLRDEVKGLKAQLKIAHKERDEIERAAGILDMHKASARHPQPIEQTKRYGDLKLREATAAIMCSDWHVGERVDPRKVNGLNKYTPEIARARARSLFTAALWLIEHHRTSWQIDTVLLWLGGDLMTGYLHDDQKQSNYLSPNQESLLVQDLVGEGLDRVLALEGIKRVRIVCNYGNHGRQTAKPQISTGAETSHEWHLYHQLARTYRNEPRIEWDIAEGEFLYTQVYDTTLRTTHGDATKYMGGVGGLTIPLNKAIAKWDTYRHADLTILGHYHQHFVNPHFYVNSSLIGPSPYGLRVGAMERPGQTFFLIDSEQGPIMPHNIWLKN